MTAGVADSARTEEQALPQTTRFTHAEVGHDSYGTYGKKNAAPRLVRDYPAIHIGTKHSWVHGEAP